MQKRDESRNLPVELLLNGGGQTLIEALDVLKADLKRVTLRLHQFLGRFKVLYLTTMVFPSENTGCFL